MEERFKKTLEECKNLELKAVEAEKEKKNVEKKYTQVWVYKCKINVRSSLIAAIVLRCHCTFLWIVLPSIFHPQNQTIAP